MLAARAPASVTAVDPVNLTTVPVWCLVKIAQFGNAGMVRERAGGEQGYSGGA
jgi:hypothetical protein